MNSYVIVVRAAATRAKAIQLAREMYPGENIEPVIIDEAPSFLKNRTLYTMEIRPIAQSNLDCYGGVPLGTKQEK